ncbi:hypothetical protein I309_05329 [Cryptococcus deuterogattii LA55]|nr:hypothetical protein I309_05329 [Cryptococcus deuterogattii LA55]KIR90042.1 hypothetical protein I304_06297 [Cryptococcus deuterogattii CBS 10090]
MIFPKLEGPYMVVGMVGAEQDGDQSHYRLLCQRRIGPRRRRVLMEIHIMAIRLLLLDLLQLPRFDSVMPPSTPIAMVAPMQTPKPTKTPVQMPHPHKTAMSISLITSPPFAKKLLITFLHYLRTCRYRYLIGNGFAPCPHDSPSSTPGCFLRSIRRKSRMSLQR